jgi:hypothetical protein
MIGLYIAICSVSNKIKTLFKALHLINANNNNGMCRDCSYVQRARQCQKPGLFRIQKGPIRRSEETRVAANGSLRSTRRASIWKATRASAQVNLRYPENFERGRRARGY